MSSTMKPRKKSGGEEVEDRPEVFGPSESEGREFGSSTVARKPKVPHVEGDDFVLEARRSMDDGSMRAIDAEAERAKSILRRKVENTKTQVIDGLMQALTRPMCEQARELSEKKQMAVVRFASGNVKDKLKEWAGEHALGRVAGAVSVVGDVKEVADAIHEAEVADMRASTVIELKNQALGRMIPLFADYRSRVDKMDGQTAIDIIHSGETSDPWVSAQSVALEFDLLVGEAMIQSGVLTGSELFDAVQAQMHPAGEEEKPQGTK